MTPLRLAVAGCTGRTGRAVVRQAVADPHFNLVAALTVAGDPNIGRDAGDLAGLKPVGIAITTDVTAECDVVIEFTTPAGTAQWALWCAAHHVALVSGTTGLDNAQKATLRSAAETVPIVWAPNMSVGVNLLLDIAARLAATLGAEWDVEVCETHHRRKVDAPSGTAALLAETIRAARDAPAESFIHGRQGLCGPRPAGQIGVHALRMGDLVGEHEVHFTCDTEMLTIRHRALSRETFAVGALRAARWLSGRQPGLHDMRTVLAD